MQSFLHLGMVGTTYRRAGQAQLAQYTLPPQQAEAELGRLAAACGFAEVVYLSTCNRVEWMFAARPGVDVAQCRLRLFAYFNPGLQGSEAQRKRLAAQSLHAFAGEGAAEHLFVVAASLDSMVPGEAQILGQVKASLRQAEAWGHVGPHLRPVFEEAFAAAKRVRADTRLGQGTVSMLSLALEVVEERLTLSAGPHSLVIVGAGEMAHQCGAAWRHRQDVRLLFVNRTLARAAALAAQYGGLALALDEFLVAPPPFAILVTATAAPEPLFDAAFFAQCTPAPYAVDLAVQRDVVPEAIHQVGGTLYDIDRLKHLADASRQARHDQMAQARHVIDEMLQTFRRRLLARQMAPAVQALRAQYVSTLETSLEALFAKALHGASSTTQNEVSLWARTLVNKLVHTPTDGLKQVGYTHGPEVVQTFLEAITATQPPTQERFE